MCSRLVALLFACASLLPAVIIDRIAVVTGNSIIKDSDIDREIRVTDFLNSQPLVFSVTARKDAASRLLDQIFIRQEIRAGDYPRATPQQAEAQMDSLEKNRFASDAAMERALSRYGLTADDLRAHLRWQLTVLSFIDERFKPAAFVSDEELQQYYDQHAAALKRQYPGRTTLNDLRPQITALLSGEKVNQLFFEWLNEKRKSADVKYLEANLR